MGLRWSKFNHWRKSEENQFYLSVALKNLSVPLSVMLITLFFFYFFLEINSLVFISNGFVERPELKDEFFVLLSEPLFQMIPWVGTHLIVFFFIGYLLGVSLLRPFKQIGLVCEEFVQQEGKSPPSMPALENFPLLKKICRFFFQAQSEILHQAKDQGKTVVIPEEFQSIHGPFLQGRYLFNFSLYVGFICTFNMASLMILTGNFYEQVVNIAIKYLNSDQASLAPFLKGQYSVLGSLVWFVGVMLAVGYLILFFNLYGKVSGPAFGIFSSMRAFLKGDTQARVHLVGFRYLRPQTRSINRCLKWIAEKRQA